MDEARGADPEPGTDEAKCQLGKDLKMAMEHQRHVERAQELERRGRADTKIINRTWAPRVGMRLSSDVSLITRGWRWPTDEQLTAWDEAAHFEGMLVMRGRRLRYGEWPRAQELATWDGADHDPFVVGWRHPWFGDLPSTTALVDGLRCGDEPAAVQPAAAQLGDPAVQRERRPLVRRPLVVAVMLVLLLTVVAVRTGWLVRDDGSPPQPASTAVSTASPSTAASITSPSTAVVVTTPRWGDDVCYRHTVSGTAQLGGGERLWLVVKPTLDPRRYPQPGGPLAVSPDGRWSGNAFFGTGADRAGGEGEAFTLDIVAASADVDARLAAYLTDGYPSGLSQLPAGTRVLVSVQVRRGAC